MFQGKVDFLVADLAKEADVANIIVEFKKRFDRLDILVNNAGILKSGTIENTPLATYDEIMNVNLRAIFQLTQLAVPLLELTKGSVVNVSSVNGVRSVGSAPAPPDPDRGSVPRRAGLQRVQGGRGPVHALRRPRAGPQGRPRERGQVSGAGTAREGERLGRTHLL